MVRNKAKKMYAYCPHCYEGVVVKDKITSEVFCARCHKEIIIPYWKNGDLSE